MSAPSTHTIWPALPRDLAAFLESSDRVTSPALLFRRPTIERNIDAALEIAGGPERFRPHVKTHKSPDMARLQMRRGVRRFKCATIAEAEMLAGAGARDVLIAYPLWGPNLMRFEALRTAFPETRFGFLVDSPEALVPLEACRAGTEVWLDLDVGMGRTGIGVDAEARSLAEALVAHGSVELAGFQVYDGHRTEGTPEERVAAVRRELAPVLELREHLGRPDLTLVCGGTPSFASFAALDLPGIECSPGTIFLHDARYHAQCPDLPFEPAAVLFTRAVSRPGADRLTLDLGSKAIAPDSPAGERGVVVSHDGLRPGPQSEEHWVMGGDTVREIPLGCGLLVVPTHVCPTVALHAEALVLDETGAVEARWPITARVRSLTI